MTNSNVVTMAMLNKAKQYTYIIKENLSVIAEFISIGYAGLILIFFPFFR